MNVQENRVRHPASRRRRQLRSPEVSDSVPNRLLDVLLALDRMVVELSMNVYNVPSPDRFLMREQNRRLHAAVRESLPPFPEPQAEAR